MIDKGMRVGVLLGGLSGEAPVSRKSGQAVAGALRSRGWDVVEIEVGRDVAARLAEERVEVAWIALHGRFGEDGCIQGLLECLGIPYTDSGVRASAVAMDKIATKRALAHSGIRMATDRVVRRGDDLSDLPVPCVVKPAVGGSTLGIAIARERGEVARAVEEALRYDAAVLVEEYVAGDEITVAVLEGTALPVVRIVPESGFFDYEAKYTKGRTRYEVPAAIPEPAATAAQRAAERAFADLGCAGLARADFIVPAEGDPVFLEINTIPGMTATSLSPMAAEAVGISFPDLVERILLAAHRMAPDPGQAG